MMEELDKSLAKITEALTELATKHGPDAVDLTLQVTRLHAINEIISALIAIVICYFAFNYCRKAANNADGFFDEVLAPAGSVIFGFVGFIGLSSRFSVATWVGMFEPKLYLAYKLMDKVL